LKPYWGKPTVRNFREGDGNVGIIRSPVRAIALPNRFIDVTVGPSVGQAESWSAPTLGKSAESQDRGGGSMTWVWGKAFRMRRVK
jgi:hypothetical protein